METEVTEVKKKRKSHFQRALVDNDDLKLIISFIRSLRKNCACKFEIRENKTNFKIDFLFYKDDFLQDKDLEKLRAKLDRFKERHTNLNL